MKAVISSTYDSKYLYFLPIVTWLWNKLGVGVICFMPYDNTSGQRFMLVSDTLVKTKADGVIYNFACPKHKEATYAQCSRLYAACLNLPEDEILITSDIDMGVFKIPPYIDDGTITIFGSDLVPANQFPICYASATVKYWRYSFSLNSISYQQALDNLLSNIDCENMRGNYWSKDQQELYNKTWEDACHITRAKPGTQFATSRYDRDDAFLLDRLSLDTIDYHMPRPGYTDENFNQILTVLQFHYPNEDFTWLKSYTEEYKRLINE